MELFRRLNGSEKYNFLTAATPKHVLAPTGRNRFRAPSTTGRS